MIGKTIIFKFKKQIYFLKKINSFCQCRKTDLTLWYYMLAHSLQINVGEGLELGVGTRCFYIQDMAFSGGGQATF
jgi:hypothetical protein